MVIILQPVTAQVCLELLGNQFDGQPILIAIIGIAEPQNRHSILMASMTEKMEHVRNGFAPQTIEDMGDAGRWSHNGLEPFDFTRLDAVWQCAVEDDEACCVIRRNGEHS